MNTESIQTIRDFNAGTWRMLTVLSFMNVRTQGHEQRLHFRDCIDRFDLYRVITM